VTWFTNHDIYEAIINKLKNPSYIVNLIVLNDRINNRREGLDFQKLIDLKGNFYYSETERMVHHKFCIIDDIHVITGSYNWTYYAENRNWENIVILDSPELVTAFIEEYSSITKQHSPIEKVSNNINDSESTSSLKYIESDYIFQAQAESIKGNDLNVAKIYTELLRINKKNEELVSTRDDILKKYNSEGLVVSPFEIGIQYYSGYRMAIPAFEKLPFTITKTGTTIADNQTSIRITIQKFDLRSRNILEFYLENIKPSPSGTLKIEFILTLDTSGLLRVVCNELDGYGKTITKDIDLKKWI
jgi:hypothetical protein